MSESKINDATEEWNLDTTKGQRSGKIMFAITRFRYIEFLFRDILLLRSREYRLLY